MSPLLPIFFLFLFFERIDVNLRISMFIQCTDHENFLRHFMDKTADALTVVYLFFVLR
jgi:hypothetical protein